MIVGGRTATARPLADGGFASRAFHPVAVVVPPRLIPWQQVRVPDRQARGSIDEFPDDVRMPGMPVGVGSYADQDVIQR